MQNATTPELAGSDLDMEPLAENDPRLRSMSCRPMPFGAWSIEEKRFKADPHVYLWNGGLFAHPDTMTRLGLGQAH